MTQSIQPNANTQVATQLKRRIRELSVMHNIARAVTSVLDLQNVLNRIVEAAIYLTGAEEGLIMLVDEASQELRLRASKGLGDKAAKVRSVPVSDSLAGQVITSGKPLRMGGNRNTDSYKVKTGYLVKSILNVPIKGHQKVIGLLSVDHALESMKTFSDKDVKLLTDLAEYAAIAIENAKEYGRAKNKVQELSKTLEEIDSLFALPTQEADREALAKFNQGLQMQQKEVTKTQDRARNLAQDLRTKAEIVEDMAHRLSVWSEEVNNLIPQLNWLVQTGLVERGTKPDKETGQVDHEIISLVRVLLSHGTDGVLLCDAKGKILQVNEIALNLLQATPKKLIGKTLLTLAPLDTRWEHLVSSLRLALALGNTRKSSPPPSTSTLYLGSKIIKSTLIPILGQDSNPNGVSIVVFLQDVSIETEGWRARDEALNALSENLRTPMAAISSYSDLLLSEAMGLITSSQRRYLQRIRQGVDKMEESLIQFTTQPREAPHHQHLQNNLTETLNEAITVAKGELNQKNINLIANIPLDIPPLQLPPEHFSKIVLDLLLKTQAHTVSEETIELNTTVQEEEGQSTYLVVNVSNQSPHPDSLQNLEKDPELKTIAKAIAYQGGRLWTEMDYAGRWIISFLLPTAT